MSEPGSCVVTNDPACAPAEERYLTADLVELPAARRWGRRPSVMGLVIALSALLVWLYWDDAIYFTRATAPQELGSTVAFKARFDRERDFDPQLPHNSHVRISGLTLLTSSAEGGTKAFFKLAYVPVYVQAGPELARELKGAMASVTVSGRLRALTRTSRFAGLERFYHEKFGVSFDRAYILEAGRLPSDFWWAPLLVVLCSCFVIINSALLLGRLRRP